MTVLSTHHEMMLDDRFCLRRPEQALVTMHLMFPLAETLYEASSKDVIRTAHPSDFRDQQSWKKVKGADSECVRRGNGGETKKRKNKLEGKKKGERQE